MNFENLKKDLAFYPVDKIVFVGLGNPLRRDDAAGLLILEKISMSRHFKNAHFIKAYTTPESHLEEILNYHPEIVVIIDAADWGGRDGEMTWIEGREIENFAISTHTYSISLIEKYLKLNARLEVKYLVIQPANMQYDLSLSKKVDKKIRQFFINTTEHTKQL